MSVAVQTTDRKVSPVVIWAGLGGVFLATQAYVYLSWIFSSDFRPTAPGADPVPANVLQTIHSYQIVNSVLGLLAIGWFAWGIRRTGRIDSIRLLMVGWLSAYWLDPWLDFLRPMFTYNAYAVNFGCWCKFIPGWQLASGSRIAEPLLIDPSSYFYNFTAAAALAWWVMRLVRRRWPSASLPALCLAGFGSIWATMAVLDIVATRFFGFDAWPIGFRKVSLWGGHFYQFPFYEFVLFPVVFVASGLLLLKTDDNGRTVVERGLGNFQPGALRTTLRVLAFIAFCNLANLSYTTAMGVHALFADGWPSDMPSWLADQQCGPKTGIACPVASLP